MPLQATSGAASYDAFGGGVAAVPNYIEECFSTFLYQGNGSTQTINNGIDLAGKGGLVWMKARNGGTIPHYLIDTSAYRVLNSNNSNAGGSGYYPTFFNPTSSGFFIDESAGWFVNTASTNFASWTFREQPKFFDVVTYTGNGTAGLTVAHNLGSVPGFVVIKRLNSSGSWPAIHRNNGTNWLQFTFNATDNGFGPPLANWFGNGTSFVAPTSTNFTVGTDTDLNANGGTYVAYLFAHDAGGFGLTGTDNVISCGSFTSDSLGQASVTLGYEPQWVMIKRTDGTSNWTMLDNMRGWAVTSSGDAALQANTSNAETSGTEWGFPTATGFSANVPTANSTFIYIAIRRGPMKTPTTGTSVFDISTVSTASGPVPGPTPTDMTLHRPTYNATNSWRANDRLRGGGLSLFPNLTDAESNEGYVYFDYQSGLRLNSWPVATAIWYNFKRAPGFFDEVCYTTGAGTGITTFSHNLGVTPELVISKTRSAVDEWYVYAQPLGTSKTLYLNANLAEQGFTCTDSLSSTQARTSIGVGSATAVSYLFASCPGVSKVGSYTGTGTTQQINCGFTAGARFVLIKRTDSTGDWYVWDSARGIVAGNDPYLLLNSTAAEVTNTDYVDTYAAGFEISSTAPAAINANGGTFIFLAIA